MKYFENAEIFEAIQFIGGQENATEVLEWLKARNDGRSRGIWVPNLESEYPEYIDMGREHLRPGVWFVIGDRSGMNYFDDEQFQARFSVKAEMPDTQGFLEHFGIGDKGDLLQQAFGMFLPESKSPKDVMMEAEEGSDSDTNESAKVEYREPEKHPQTYYTIADALQFDGTEERAMEIVAWVEEEGSTAVLSMDGKLLIKSGGLQVYITKGMWVLHMSDGSFATCTDQVFKKHYDLYPMGVANNPQGYPDLQRKSEQSADAYPEPGPVDEGFVGIEKELSSLLNRYSAESVSGTPDFILAKFLIESLKTYNETVSHRAEWRGELVDFRPRPAEVDEETATASDNVVPLRPEPPKDSKDTGVSMFGSWYPRYFQLLGSDSHFYVGQEDGSVRLIEKSVIPTGHMVYPINSEQLLQFPSPSER